MRHTGVIGPDGEFARVLESEIGRDRPEVAQERDERGDPEGPPVDIAVHAAFFRGERLR